MASNFINQCAQVLQVSCYLKSSRLFMMSNMIQLKDQELFKNKLMFYTKFRTKRVKKQAEAELMLNFS